MAPIHRADHSDAASPRLNIGPGFARTRAQQRALLGPLRLQLVLGCVEQLRPDGGA